MPEPLAEHDADVRSGDIESTQLSDDGTFPNNASLPVIAYRDVFVLHDKDPAAVIESVFRRNGWSGLWRNGIYSYHHYHSTAHEVLGVARGAARVQLGGDNGSVFELSAGDCVVLPAGVAHKNLGADADFLVVGAYPDFLVVGAYPQGQDWDMNYGRPDERPQADQNIQRTPLPEADPVFGADGPLVIRWNLKGPR